MPKTKIICALGPASDKANVLLRMMRAGIDVIMNKIIKFTEKAS